ncbi:protein SOB FIVE-LIKE 5-like [Argentina anserina]|uniref:protein SOB FIVE-LIKE 5-like n=1 Tax=Argentina anserina TaxID=57926 RepID=UPI00217689F6|nr:protein SOB FIVE-LIKE 5-like [Potentilla anserina]
MDVLASECSSGCESGWTLYLEQSVLSQHPSGLHKDGFCEEYKEKRISYSNEDEEEEEDQSMVSDASSGPPHFNEDEVYFDENNNGGFYSPSKDVQTLKYGGRKQRIKDVQTLNQDLQQHQPSFLDDTASSPLFNISKNNFMVSNNQASGDSVLDYSQGFSSTHFQGRSAYQNHYGFFQSGNQLLDQNQWFEGNEITRSSYHK